jgi:hypothetical protein
MHDLNRLAWTFEAFRRITEMMDEINAEALAPERDDDAFSQQVAQLMDYVSDLQDTQHLDRVWLNVTWANQKTDQRLKISLEAKLVPYDDDDNG